MVHYTSSNAFLESVEMIVWFPAVFAQSEPGVSPRLALKDPPHDLDYNLQTHYFLLFKNILMKKSLPKEPGGISGGKGGTKELKSGRRLEITCKPRTGLHFCHRLTVTKPPNSVTRDW